SSAARAAFAEADRFLGDRLGAPLSEVCLAGPGERLNATDVAQPALYVCGVASWHGMTEAAGAAPPITEAAGLSLGEYTALHLAGAFEFATGLSLVAERGRLMQQAAEASAGGMVAIIGAEEAQAVSICEQAAQGEVLVCANFNAPGQIVLSGHQTACDRAAEAAASLELSARPLEVAGAFHSPLMQPAADALGEALAAADLACPPLPVFSNVTARPHDPEDGELLRQRLVEQIVSPVRWHQTCLELGSGGKMTFHELAPGTVLRGLMRRIDRNKKVNSHDHP
ncbi:MAG: ACP S-malonyltransferase, partial [Planctomycetota bacterium]